MERKTIGRAAGVMLCVMLGLLLLGMLVRKMRKIHHSNQFAGVLITGHHHMGPNFSVSDFYVNGYSGSNVGREGGGGRAVCCVLLPKKWRHGLVAEVRWQVGDWTLANVTPKKKGTFNNAKWKNYKAIVPVERYETAEQLYVHFFRNGRVRAVSSVLGVHHADHPVAHGDSSSEVDATKGTVIAELFSKAELAERDTRTPKRRM